MPRILADALTPGPRPLLTHYDLDREERTELSGLTTANWAEKIANQLVDEWDVGRGTRIALDLPSHWRRFVWLLGVWRVGAVVTDTDADLRLDADRLVAVDVPATADVFIGLDPPEPQDLALDLSAPLTHADLLTSPPVGDRLLRRPAALEDDAHVLVSVLLGRGSLVLVTGGTEDELARIAGQERAVVDGSR